MMRLTHTGAGVQSSLICALVIDSFENIYLALQIWSVNSKPEIKVERMQYLIGPILPKSPQSWPGPRNDHESAKLHKDVPRLTRIPGACAAR